MATGRSRVTAVLPAKSGGKQSGESNRVRPVACSSDCPVLQAWGANPASQRTPRKAGNNGFSISLTQRRWCIPKPQEPNPQIQNPLKPGSWCLGRGAAFPDTSRPWKASLRHFVSEIRCRQPLTTSLGEARGRSAFGVRRARGCQGSQHKAVGPYRGSNVDHWASPCQAKLTKKCKVS